MAAEIPERVLRFLQTNVTNVAQLELLLHIRCAPDRWWTADDVARPLATRAAVAQRDLEHLHGRGLVARSTDEPLRYRYEPRELAPVIDELAGAYTRRRTQIVNHIFAEPDPDAAAASLAEAFRFRRK